MKTYSLLECCVELARSKAFCGPANDSMFTAAQILDVFRHMQAARHIGKIVITLLEDPLELELVPFKPTPTSRGERRCLLTGGLGGLGRSVAT